MTWVLVALLVSAEGRLELAFFEHRTRPACEEARATLAAQVGPALLASRCRLSLTV